MDNKKYKIEYPNNSLIILEAILVFDEWLLMKARWLLINFFQIVVPILKFCFILLMGAGLLMAYCLANAKFAIPDHSRYFNCKNSKLSDKYLQLNDDSMPSAMSVRKELIQIKNMKMSIKKSLLKMNFHLQHLYDQQKLANLADFASEAVGGIVIDTPGTQSYYNPSSNQMTLFGIPIFKPNYFTPRKVIQPWTQAGECWAFRGSQGKIEIQLAYAVIIERVTLEHITATASLTGNIDSAPKAFNVLGQIDNQYVMIDTFVYKNNGQSLQSFAVTKPETKSFPFKKVILEILSNWGNPDYTCIYRFKVHGKMYDVFKEEANMKVQ
ncbi:hypothetical protein TSAR_013127 [Trichomalopsis sarcophagae]|uniref:SUN domain-containing protein n=1 Tax=Trichomalopsis sarcophagae TaxID=543379 RepID=A0A232F2M9_9HYME|nr:hypothetical protein TSAR_013127 [Trichomalopsis sarcophagae]